MTFFCAHFCATYVCTTKTYLYCPSWPNVYTECTEWGQKGKADQSKNKIGFIKLNVSTSNLSALFPNLRSTMKTITVLPNASFGAFRRSCYHGEAASINAEEWPLFESRTEQWSCYGSTCCFLLIHFVGLGSNVFLLSLHPRSAFV